MYKDQEARIIILAGGSFQGKSIIALEIARKFKFSGVISTDMVRNVLKTLWPREEYLSTSTYLLPEPLLLKQMDQVSAILQRMISIYRNRGEHIIIEGMHFSKDFIEWVSLQNFFKIFVNNRLPFQQRVIYKTITRSRLRLYDSNYSKYIFGPVNESNINDSVYIKYQQRITQIHDHLLALCVKNGFQVIDFDDIEDGITKAIDSVERWLSRKQTNI